MTTVNVSHLAGYKGEEMDTQEIGSFGVPYLQFFNPATLHVDTEIEKGGWGVKTGGDGGYTPPNFGPTQTITHQGNRTSNMVVTNKPLEMAIIWYSGPYTRWWPDGDRSKGPRIFHQDFLFQNMHKAQGGRAETGVSLFVALKCDEQRDILEILGKTYAVDDWLRILSLTRRRVAAVADFLIKAGELPKGFVLPIYSQWIKIGVGGFSTEGTGDKTSLIAHPEIEWPGLETPLKALWTAAAQRKPGKAMICDGDKQWSQIKDVLKIDDLIACVPSDQDMARFDEQRKFLVEKHKTVGFRAIAAPTPENISKAKGEYMALPSGNTDGEPPMPDEPGEPVGPTGPAATAIIDSTPAPAKQIAYDENGNEVVTSPSLGEEVTANSKVASDFFNFVKKSFDVAPPKVFQILGVKSLTNVKISQDEALALIERFVNGDIVDKAVGTITY